MSNLLAYDHGHDGCLLSSSPHTILSRFLLFVDHVDNARGRRHDECTMIRLRRIYNFLLFHPNILQLLHNFENFLYYFSN